MKRGLGICLMLLLLNWTPSLSQGIPSDSSVHLPRWRAQLVAADLIRLDRADSIILIMDRKLEIETQKVLVLETIVENLEQINENNAGIISALQTQINVKDKESSHWKKQYKKQKRQKIVSGAIGIAAIVGILVLVN